MNHPIPIDALDSDIAILGRKGGGKSYTAKGIVERLLDLGRRVLILDPLGVWAGLRTGTDGESEGYPVAIFGGLHADLPLDPAAAAPLARIVAAENLPAVIDLSELSKTKQQAFLYAFLHELRTVNREALTIVLEEADVFAPQNPQGDDSKQLHGEIDWIARRGRFRGFRLITITQRPARLSKDVLTQSATLIAHRLPAPQDRDAVKAWVDGNGDAAKAREVFDTLAQLTVGEAWVWAPEHDLLERIHFPRIKTLDTSSTPKAGEKRIEPKTLAQVDVSAIRDALAAAAPDEPTTKKGAKGASLAEVAAAERLGYERGYEAGRDTMRIEASARVRDALLSLGTDAPAETQSAYAHPERSRDPTVAHAAPHKKAVLDVAGNPLLEAALSVWPARLTWPALASMCGRKARGGHFNSVRKALIDGGLVRMDGEFVIPRHPPAVAAGVKPADLLEQNLPQPAGKMFAAIRKRPGMTVVGLAGVLGMQPRGGHWNFGMATLRTNGLIDHVGDILTIKPELEGAAR
jgi:hypothetical protein